MKNNNIFYNYIYLDPRKPGDYNYGEYHFDYEPFYVGKGCKERYRKKHNKDCEKIRKEIRLSGLEEKYEFPYKDVSEDYAYDIEPEIIKTIGRKDLGFGPLLNKADGGRAPVNVIFTEETKRKMSENNRKYWFGKHHSEETKRKIRIARSKQIITEETKRKISEGNKGKIYSEETKQKIRNAKGGKNHHFYGKHLSEEHKIKLREANKGKILSEEHKRKIGESNKGKIYSEETRRKIGLSGLGRIPWNKGKKMSEEHKRKLSEAHKGKKIPEEQKRKMSEAQNKRRGLECEKLQDCCCNLIL
ncbi:MAG: NUMOD3 domain-containing DNA-binding protein [Methanogenium sp.]|jgi:hypothetical protein